MASFLRQHTAPTCPETILLSHFPTKFLIQKNLIANKKPALTITYLHLNHSLLYCINFVLQEILIANKKLALASRPLSSLSFLVCASGKCLSQHRACTCQRNAIEWLGGRSIRDRRVAQQKLVTDRQECLTTQKKNFFHR